MRRSILIVSSVVGSALVMLAGGIYLATQEAVAALPLVFGLLLLLPLAASRRQPISRELQLQNMRRYRAAMVIWRSLARLALGVALFVVSFLLMFLYAYAKGAPSRSDDDGA